MFQRAKKQSLQHLDIINLTKNMQKLTLFFKNMITKQQRVLLMLHRKNTIGFKTDESNSMTDSVDELNYGLQKESTAVNVFTLGKMNKILKPLT